MSIAEEVPPRLVERLAESLTRAVAAMPTRDLVAVVVVYHHMPPDSEADPVEIYGCSAKRREELLRLYPSPDGAVYMWSNLEFDSYLPGDVADGALGSAWQDAYAFAQSVYEQTDLDSDEFDDTQVPRAVLVDVCRMLNEGGWKPSRPSPLAPDGVIYPAALGGVDPDTPDNLRAVLSEEQRRSFDTAGYLPA